MGKPGRQANFELLRIIAMFMVVILHWNTNSGLLLDVGSPVTGAGVWSLVTESVCIVAVNVYVLISGYFLSSCTFSFRRVAQVLVQTLFYTVLIPPVLALVGVLPWSEVLVLDEATSALDNDTEAAIMESINSLHGHKTLIIIAHRLQTIEKCDIVYRVEHGEIERER